MNIRVLLADDHAVMREGLRALIAGAAGISVIGDVADGRAAVQRVAELKPDVVVMDVSMPQVNGLKATEMMKTECPEVRVVTLTRHADDAYLQQLLRAGASGYVLKQSRAAELLHAIRAVVAGGTYVDPTIADRLVSSLGRRPPLSSTATPGTKLSPREEEILRLVAWGYSNKEIAAQLDLSVKTVETHKANATQKLGLQNRIDVVRFALLQGWLRDT